MSSIASSLDSSMHCDFTRPAHAGMQRVWSVSHRIDMRAVPYKMVSHVLQVGTQLLEVLQTTPNPQ